jgi:hypothetical protein
MWVRGGRRLPPIVSITHFLCNHGDSKFPHTVKSVTSRKNISAANMRKLMGENAARLYSI